MLNPYIEFDDNGAWLGIGDAATPDAIPAGAVACTTDQYAAAGPWTTLVDGAIVIGAPPPPTLGQQATAMLAAGLTIASTGTPALNGTYACDPATTQNIQAEIISIMLNSTFADGGATVAWPDVAGALHSFDIAAFKSFAAAIAAFVAVLTRIALSNSGTLPSTTTTIP
jgi:hypothetical protein